MARRPTEPRYYRSRRGYYLRIGKRLICLARGPEGGDTLARAWGEFRKYIPERQPRCTIMTEEEYRRMQFGASYQLHDVLRRAWEDGWVGWTASDRKAFQRQRDRFGLRRELTLLAVKNAWAIRTLAAGGSLDEVVKKLGLSLLRAKRLYLT